MLTENHCHHRHCILMLILISDMMYYVMMRYNYKDRARVRESSSSSPYLVITQNTIPFITQNMLVLSHKYFSPLHDEFSFLCERCFYFSSSDHTLSRRRAGGHRCTVRCYVCTYKSILCICNYIMICIKT
jgi:hypothetical protein